MISHSATVVMHKIEPAKDINIEDLRSVRVRRTIEPCPRCHRRSSVGNIGKNKYFCKECLREFEGAL